MPSPATKPYAPGVASALRTTDPAAAQEAFHRPRWLREEQEMDAFAAIGMSAASAGELVDFHDNYEKAEVELDLMFREAGRV